MNPRPRGALYPWREYVRPWKLFSFAIGVALLVAGALQHLAPDWDVPISFIMASLTYLTAPWSVRVFLERQWRLWPLALFATWLSVDGCYWMYWAWRNPVALDQMRSANLPASFSLYLICGVLWLYRGSLRELYADIQGFTMRP